MPVVALILEVPGVHLMQLVVLNAGRYHLHLVLVGLLLSLSLMLLTVVQGFWVRGLTESEVDDSTKGKQPHQETWDCPWVGYDQDLDGIESTNQVPQYQVESAICTSCHAK